MLLNKFLSLLIKRNITFQQVFKNFTRNMITALLPAGDTECMHYATDASFYSIDRTEF